jgi:hypothetical protein
MRRIIAIITGTALLVTGMAHSSPPPPGWEKIPPKTMAYKDRKTRVTLYVESDGKHIAAIDENGKLLWVRSPYEESRGNKWMTIIRSLNEEPRRADGTNYAGYFEQSGIHTKPEDELIEVYFASNFFGQIDERTGDFVFIGIN